MEGKNNESAITLENLHKSFGTQKVLNGINLKVTQGETFVVLGRSGTGKSVLLKLIIGLQKPDVGTIRIHGQEITELSLDRLNEVRQKMGFLFQDAALYDLIEASETYRRIPAAAAKQDDGSGTERLWESFYRRSVHGGRLQKDAL